MTLEDLTASRTSISPPSIPAPSFLYVLGGERRNGAGPIVALGAACDGPGGRGFALGIGTVLSSSHRAGFVTPGWDSPTGMYLDDPLEDFRLSAEDSAALHAIMSVGSPSALEFLV